MPTAPAARAPPASSQVTVRPVRPCQSRIPATAPIAASASQDSSSATGQR
jgi:hypothetical protein